MCETTPLNQLIPHSDAILAEGLQNRLHHQGAHPMLSLTQLFRTMK